MERQTERCEPVAQIGQEPLGRRTVLDSDDDIIRIPHDDHIAAGLRRSPRSDPQIEHVVQVDVGQKGANAPTLDGPYLTRCSRPIFQHAGVQPFLDESNDAPIPNSVLEKLHEPPVFD